VQRVRREQWYFVGKFNRAQTRMAVDMTVALEVPLVARFAIKECHRLEAKGLKQALRYTQDDVEILRKALPRDPVYLPVAG